MIIKMNKEFKLRVNRLFIKHEERERASIDKVTVYNLEFKKV